MVLQKQRNEKKVGCSTGKRGGGGHAKTYSSIPGTQKNAETKKKLDRRGSNHRPVCTKLGALPLSQNTRGYENISPEGMIMFHPRQKSLTHYWKPKTGDKNKIPGGTGLRKCWKPLPPRGSASFPGTEQFVHRGAPFDAPRSPSLALGPVLSPMTPWAAVWGGRGVVARPRGVRRRTGEPVLRGAY